MSKTETMQWLNNYCLIGFTDQRGTFWHYRENEQGEEPNHYPGAIPVEDVIRRLFFWQPLEGTITATVNEITEEGVTTSTYPGENRKAIIRPRSTFGPQDQGGIIQVFRGVPGESGYTVHDRKQWLIDNMELLLDQGLFIGSAGLLRMGALAWVQVEKPETVDTPQGVSFRPHVLAASSLDGSVATTYSRAITVVGCDNTLSAALREPVAKVKRRHTSGSLTKVDDIRQALGLIERAADDFQLAVQELTERTVTEKQWQQFLDVEVPLKDGKGDDKKGRALTMATNHREALQQLWVADDRVAPWRNTAWGVVQANNTYAHHVQSARGATKVERNMVRAVQGDVDQLDLGTLRTLDLVLAA